jgi:bifunctional DNase/RNase
MTYRYRHRRERLLNRALALGLAAAIVALIYLTFFPSPPPTIPLLDITTLPELSTTGYVEVDVDAAVVEGRGIVSLTGNCWRITATTEPTQAQSIKNGLEGVIGFRPNTHDLMRDIFESLEMEVIMVKIVDMRENTYIGRLILRQGNRVLSLDSRPSDGTAVAVRVGAPIYIKEELLKRHGQYVC